MIANKHERPKRRENQRPAREVLSLEKIAGQEIARPCYRPVYQGRAVRLHGVSAHSRGCRASFLGRDGRNRSAQAGQRVHKPRAVVALLTLNSRQGRQVKPSLYFPHKPAPQYVNREGV